MAPTDRPDRPVPARTARPKLNSGRDGGEAGRPDRVPPRRSNTDGSTGSFGAAGDPLVRRRDPAGGVPPTRRARPEGRVDGRTGETAESRPDDGRPDDGRRRRLLLGAATALFLVPAAVLGIGALRDRQPPPDRSRVLPVEAWAPYWALEESQADLPIRGPLLRTLSPFWFSVTGATTIEASPNVNEARAEEFVAAARRLGIPLVPALFDEMGAGGMAGVLADPVTRTAHVDALMRFADQWGADGLDLDYEAFAFEDDPSTWPAIRPNWVAFITELSARLHAKGLTLTVSIPPVYDAGQTAESGRWVYDYSAITPLVDTIRVMAYDYSTSSAGPIAPLTWVQQVLDGVTAASGDPSKLVLGIPLYGYNWPVATTGVCPADQQGGRETVRLRIVPELVAKRAAIPTYDPLHGEWTFRYQLPKSDATTSCTETREVWYVDAAGAQARIDLADKAGWAGVSLWALGYDDQALWDTFAAANAAKTTTTTTG